MIPPRHLVLFILGRQQFALPLAVVERVLRAVEVTTLPQAPEIVLGLVNVKGEVVPVFNVRRRFRFPEREIEPDDQFILARTSTRIIALAVDGVTGILECDGRQVTSAEQILPGLEHVKGVLKREDGLVLIHDLDTFLSLAEEQALEGAMKP